MTFVRQSWPRNLYNPIKVETAFEGEDLVRDHWSEHERKVHSTHSSTFSQTCEAVFKHIGHVQLPDLLMEVDAATHFSEALQARRPASGHKRLAVYGALLAPCERQRRHRGGLDDSWPGCSAHYRGHAPSNSVADYVGSTVEESKSDATLARCCLKRLLPSAR
ncbi:MAG: hypothetical protein EOP82_24680 [Variovorax sp.]|nr:MAG: hypothetical protein EOP82_24680 [Variovorax sp.]